jgi:hypothetical protein
MAFHRRDAADPERSARYRVARVSRRPLVGLRGIGVRGSDEATAPI